MFKCVIFVFSAFFLFKFCHSQWTPDPLCPYPSEVVTNFPYYGNCSLYWACFEGSKFLVKCPEGQEFDVETSTCTSPEVAQCDPYVSTSTTESTSSSTSTTITKSTSTTSSPSTTESSTTTGSTTTDSTTTGSTTTDKTTTDSTTTDSSSTTEEPYPQCPPTEDLIYLPYLGDCTKYWECYKGDSYLYSCPDGLWWHQEVLQCDFPGDFCDNSTTSPDTTVTDKTTSITTTVSTTTGSTSTEGPYPECPSSEGIIYLPYLGDCTKYWECIDGASFLYNCPEGLWWHQEILQCDYPGDFCHNSTTSPDTTVTVITTRTPTTVFSTTGGTTTEGPYPECPSSEGIIYLPYWDDCTKYWECIDGASFLYNCPEGLWWHQEILQCDYPGDFCDNSTTVLIQDGTVTVTVTIQDETTSTPTTQFFTIPTTGFTSAPDPNDIICQSPNDDAVYFPVTDDCTRYWECFEGVKYLLVCPPGLWWQEKTQKCEEPGDYCQTEFLM